MIQFTVLGRPQPAGSKKAFAHPTTKRIVVVDDAKGSRAWKQEVAGEAHRAHGVALLTGPLALTLRFYVARPKGHYGQGRNAGTMKPAAPLWPTTRPDATKLTRAVEDAITGVVWKDDAQVVAQTIYKHYGEPERVEVTIESLALTRLQADDAMETCA